MAVVGTDCCCRLTRIFRKDPHHPSLPARIDCLGYRCPLSRLQWAGMVGCYGQGALLVLVFIAEYIAVDLQDVRIVPVASASRLFFALYLVLSVAIVGRGAFVSGAAGITPTMFLVALRTLTCVSMANGAGPGNGVVTGRRPAWVGLHYLHSLPFAMD